MLPLEFIKEKLLQHTNTIRFLSLFSDFTKVTLVWGDNRNLNQGLHIQQNFQKFYDIDTSVDEKNENLGLNPEKTVADLVNLSKKPIKDNDDILMF